MHQSGCYTENLVVQVWASLYRNGVHNKIHANSIIQVNQVRAIAPDLQTAARFVCRLFQTLAVFKA
jgi:hypothetical protein